MIEKICQHLYENLLPNGDGTRQCIKLEGSLITVHTVAFSPSRGRHITTSYGIKIQIQDLADTEMQLIIPRESYFDRESALGALDERIRALERNTFVGYLKIVCNERGVLGLDETEGEKPRANSL